MKDCLNSASDGPLHTGLRALGIVALACTTAIATAAQDGTAREERPEVDPYTEGDAKAMERAGYLSFGPFLFAGSHTTEVAEKALGGVPLIWVETAHFKIGSTLEPYRYSDDPKEKKKIQAELKALKKRLPGVKNKPKELDPWLRLHLWAMRLEALYESFCEEFGFRDDMFPAPPGTVPYVGEGKYLGLEAKFAVLLTEKRSSLARYTSSFCDRQVDNSYRYYFPESKSLFFGMSREGLEGVYDNDSAMHYAVAFNVAQNLGNGYRGYTHEAPPWWNLGLARWFARRVDPRWLLYTTSGMGGQRFEEKDSLWPQKVRARVEQEVFDSMPELMNKRSFEEIGFNEHMMIWSRVDFIMSLDQEEKRGLITYLQEPAAWSGAVFHGESLEDQFAKALTASTGMDEAEFDRRWVKFVLSEYPKR